METLINNEDKLFYSENFISEDEAQDYHIRLFKELDWHEEQLFVADKLVTVPRLVCWYGDPWVDYIYMGVNHQPKRWLPILEELKARVEIQTEQLFNGVLATQYRDENDFMTWHANEEPGLGPDPLIATVAFGENRLFKARNKNTVATTEVMITNGSLLVMAGKFQHHWRHGIARSTVPKGNHITLSFRKIISV